MGKYKTKAQVISQEVIATDIMSLVIKAETIANEAVAGQFVSLYSKDGGHLLPRPISLCEIDKKLGTIRLVYRIVGYGTKEFSGLKAGDMIDIMGPLGNGFMKKDSRAIIIGGGIGIPPMLELSRELSCEKNIVLGYRDELFLNEEFEPYGNVYISSEDGNHGARGNVIDAIKANGVTGDIIYACGPTPMLRGIKQYAEENNIMCQISMEEKMACGIGACLACVCKTKDVDEHSQVKNKRICADGPVFDAREVEL